MAVIVHRERTVLRQHCAVQLACLHVVVLRMQQKQFLGEAKMRLGLKFTELPQKKAQRIMRRCLTKYWCLLLSLVSLKHYKWMLSVATETLNFSPLKA
jgi:hypothetical protein